MNTHETRQDRPWSHLFTVRLWQEEMGDNRSETRMQVKHLLSGETRYFRAWPALVDYMRQFLNEDDPAA